MTSEIPARLVPRWAMCCYSALVRQLRKNHLLSRGLFGFRPPSGVNGQLWDWTTLLLRKALAHRLRRGASLLDMGTGPIAVLGIYARQRLQAGRVCAVDHVSEVRESARQASALANADIEFLGGSLFTEVRGQFDVIAFNAPYIDLVAGSRLSLLDTELARQRWCGGADGMQTIDRFLADAHEFLLPKGEILLGVNRFYVSEAMVRASAGRAGVRVTGMWTNCFTRAAVYQLQPTKGR